MRILPAIDLIGGQVVRLTQGDYARVSVYDDDPVRVAIGMRDKGARYLHLVDLDGAKRGAAVNHDVIGRICKESGLLVEIGGGIRTREQIETYLQLGADKVILGTVAIRDPEFTRNMAQTYGDAIAVGVDARDGKVAVQGWLEVTQTDALEFCRKLFEDGVRQIIYTDIARDGAMQGVNLQPYRALAEIQELRVTASGGVCREEDLRALREIGTDGAIIGKALYTGAISLERALTYRE